MKRTITVIAVVLATILAASNSAHAVAPQVGIVSLEGDLEQGGHVNYKFDFQTVRAGTLIVKAQLTQGTKKALFPPSTSGRTNTTTVTGPTIVVPSNFAVGTALLKLKINFNNRRIANRTVVVTITTPTTPPPPASVPTTIVNLGDVGFNSLITLDGTKVPTTGMGLSLTYTWKPLSTIASNVTLSSSNAVSPTFTTHALTNFVNMGTTAYNNDIDDAGYTNLLYVTPEHRFGTSSNSTKVSGIAMDAEQVDESTYTFRLLVSDNSITRTGTYTVVCASQTPAHPNIPVGVTAFYKAATNSLNWTLTYKPAKSSAALTHTNELIAQLRPDVEGVYIVRDNVTGKSLTNNAASWTGVEFCALCHGAGNNVNQDDIVAKWSLTKHATKLQRELDGSQGAYYAESCIKCHSVGYNKAASANNGGFDDVQAAVGWKFPAGAMKPGNYDAVPDALKAVSNIQCENCHGPGSRHPGSPSISLDVKVCASCHQDGSHHVRPQQWEISPHAGAYENLATHNSASCARCHVPAGFISATISNGVAYGAVAGITNPQGSNAVVTGPTGPLTCQVCHDPHDTFGDTTGNRHQLRVYDNVLLGNPLKATSPTVYVGLGDSLTTANLQLTNSSVTVTNAGGSAACMVCHNAREWPTQIQVSGSNSNKMYYQTAAPSMSTAGDIFAGLGGYDYGQEMRSSFHTQAAKLNNLTCQTCHMYKLQAGDTILTNDVAVLITTTNLAAYANVVGDHTFKMDYVAVSGGVTNVVDNIAACNQCHAGFGDPVDSFDFKGANAQDYDGNGSVDGIQTETQGVLMRLETLLYSTGVKDTVSSRGGITKFGGSFSTTNAVAEAQHKAVYNWSLERYEGSFGVHNTAYTIKLLQSTYTDLSTNYWDSVNGSGTLSNYANAFPLADIRQ